MKNPPQVKLFTSEQIREIDAYTIAHEPIDSIDLMERAANSIFNWIQNNHPENRKISIFAGSGNNGGDGLAVGRLLINAGWNVTIYLADYSDHISKDCKINLERLRKLPNVDLIRLSLIDQLPDIDKENLVVDALFGSGLSRPLDGTYAKLVKHINASKAWILSIDIPSGLFGEDNTHNIPDHIIQAKKTLSLQFEKIAFQFAENYKFVGHTEVLPINLHADIIERISTPYRLNTRESFESSVKDRPLFSHKGNFGHVLLISGCLGKMGAAVLASRACLRSGVGLLTTHVPKMGMDIIQNSVPEAMISQDQSDIIFTQAPDLSEFSHVGIGPAMGCKSNSQKGLEALIDILESPMVIDADAINILGSNSNWIAKLPENSILTPHPKEFYRLTGFDGNGFERHMHQIGFSQKNKLIVVLKGARSSITLPDGSCYFNCSGNAGMATAGSGDVLTGILLALLGQGYEPGLAARLGVFVHGLAGDLALEKTGPEALIASDIIENLGSAFKIIRSLAK